MKDIIIELRKLNCNLDANDLKDMGLETEVSVDDYANPSCNEAGTHTLSVTAEIFGSIDIDIEDLIDLKASSYEYNDLVFVRRDDVEELQKDKVSADLEIAYLLNEVDTLTKAANAKPTGWVSRLF